MASTAGRVPESLRDVATAGLAQPASALVPHVRGAGAPLTRVGTAAVFVDMDDTLTPEVKVWPDFLRGLMRDQNVAPDRNDMFDLGLAGTDLTLRMYDLGVRSPGLDRDRPREEHAAGMRAGADQAVVAAIHDRGREFMPGADAMLAALAASPMRVGLVTSAGNAIAEASLRALERASRHGFRRDMFDTMVTLDKVAHGKPHPEPYLRAAADLGVDPARCVAFEDSHSGVHAANTAGMGTTVAVTGTGNVPRGPRIHRVPSLEHVSVLTVAGHPVLTVGPPRPQHAQHTLPPPTAVSTDRERAQAVGRELRKG
ncbi:HAD family hydrolase [Yinghuangia sp. ASG 101]|uniref:HAD family hydrolase n=1 Tax=Yinghuangia sp. ASG 101 TaxID=2896848 RepID=UPI001E5F5C50|nr:HAD family hydrolase [Yinghuangia sp. ASG 101]UGQ11369.1 HAD family hydrolase [Yinghuangia sp. ASG 101]